MNVIPWQATGIQPERRTNMKKNYIFAKSVSKLSAKKVIRFKYCT